MTGAGGWAGFWVVILTAAVGAGATVVGELECDNVVLEPGFEAGPGSAWSESSSHGYPIVSHDTPRTGSYSAWLGGDHREDAAVWQEVTISGDAVSATLTYWYDIDSEDYCDWYDQGGLQVDGLEVPGHLYELCGANSTGGFVLSAAVDLLSAAGSTVEIRWWASTDENLLSNLFIDDVVLEVCVPATGPATIFSDDLESGDLSGWSSVLGGSSGVRDVGSPGPTAHQAGERPPSCKRGEDR